ncbi:MAG: class I SAM-dependent methyltransferase [Thermoleophilia bacterium]
MSGGQERPPTPVDLLLQSSRPHLDRASSAGTGLLGRARRALRRGITTTDRTWYQEQKDFEVLLRNAIAHLSLEAEGERLAREQAERDTTAVRVRVDAHDGAMERLDGALAELNAKLRHLEARQRADAAALVRSAVSEPRDGGIPPLDDFDYLAFEDRFRGPEDEVRARQAAHADRLAASGGPVADIGCGRGELLELMRDRGVDALGVDASAEMVGIAVEKGLAAELGDAFAWLAAREAGSLGGIIVSHVVEHLWPADQVRLARLCAAALRPGGLIVIETPNPKSLIAGAINFWCDPTHLRPVYPETLAFILERTGFDDVQIEYLAPVPDEHRANPVADPPPGTEAAFAQVDEALRRLDSLVFGDRDYAVIARAAGG